MRRRAQAHSRAAGRRGVGLGGLRRVGFAGASRGPSGEAPCAPAEQRVASVAGKGDRGLRSSRASQGRQAAQRWAPRGYASAAPAHAGRRPWQWHTPAASQPARGSAAHALPRRAAAHAPTSAPWRWWRCRRRSLLCLLCPPRPKHGTPGCLQEKKGQQRGSRSPAQVKRLAPAVIPAAGTPPAPLTCAASVGGGCQRDGHCCD